MVVQRCGWWQTAQNLYSNQPIISTGTGGFMASRGGHRLGAGRKRRLPPSSKPVSNEVQRFANSVFKGVGLWGLSIAPEGSSLSDDELVELAVADLIRAEIRRGKGGEVLRLMGNVVAMMASSQGDEAEGSGSALADALSRMPGADAAPVPAAPEVMGSGRSVRELSAVLKNAGEGRSIAPHQQQELFDASLPGGTVLN